MTPPIQLTGGAGTLEGRVVRHLREAGRDARVFGRRGHRSRDGIGYVTGELAAGEGTEAAVDGARAIAPRAGGADGEEDETGYLLRATSRAEHVAYVSVVGADRVPVVKRVERAVFGYFESGLAPERDVGHRSWEQFLADRVGDRPIRPETRSGRPRRRTSGRTRLPQGGNDESPTGLPTGPIRRSRR